MQVTDERTALEKSTQVEQVEGEEKGNENGRRLVLAILHFLGGERLWR